MINKFKWFGVIWNKIKLVNLVCVSLYCYILFVVELEIILCGILRRRIEVLGKLKNDFVESIWFIEKINLFLGFVFLILRINRCF